MEELQQLTEIVSTDCKPPLCQHVTDAVQAYLVEMDGYDLEGLYDLVMQEVEKPLLQAVLSHAGYNQTKAAKVLGLSRSTLRKKIDFYRLG